ncbi:MAG: class I SAM-dependent methyltransferase [Desulfobacteraceae bacterium]|nr:class I SAM-dependent methyltransferase [Desulfobacteraceae bacterium]
MDDKTIKRYFEENATRWLTDAYAKSDYTYPAGLHRSRILMRILTQRFGPRSLNLLDIGCGGGDLCFLEAEVGHQATGVDQSETMISHAENSRRALSDEIRARLIFVRADLRTAGDELPRGTYDAVTAMGVIYYLPDDDALFACARDLLTPGGLLVVSCRNRLFNMVSISDYTAKEIEGGSALDLIADIEELYHPIPQDNATLFIENLKHAVSLIPSAAQRLDKERTSPVIQDDVNTTPGYTFNIEGRQHTPNQLKANAAKFGFVNRGYYGVHPHLLIPKLNKRLPPQVFNLLSDCLSAFEDLPISLTWSSQFIGVFEKE